MSGLVILKVESNNPFGANETAEMLYDFFFAYGWSEEAKDFFNNLGNEFVEVPDKFRDKLDIINFKNFVRKPTNEELSMYLQT